MTKNGEPEIFDEVKANVNMVNWIRAMQNEMKSFYDNCTYELANFSKGKRALANK